MPWFSKEQPTPFDMAQFPGLEFLHGDILAKAYRQSWIEGKKYPLISFPSGVKREIRNTDAHPEGAVNIFDGMEVRFHTSRDQAYAQALALATERGYRVSRTGTNTLHLANPHSKRTYELIFDERTGYLANIELFPHHAMELLDGVSRALLPPLYANEPVGLAAVAPIKFLTAASGWTWYPTEFDGDDLCFGLVSGFEVELGYFSIAELEAVRDPLGLPIERDLYFEPASLQALIALHQH